MGERSLRSASIVMPSTVAGRPPRVVGPRMTLTAATAGRSVGRDYHRGSSGDLPIGEGVPGPGVGYVRRMGPDRRRRVLGECCLVVGSAVLATISAMIAPPA